LHALQFLLDALARNSVNYASGLFGMLRLAESGVSSKSTFGQPYF
jgi:hypothetical protein